ncbi:MAG: hypoxanthine phosphoribosyltransferase [Rhodospirillales bacterium]
MRVLFDETTIASRIGMLAREIAEALPADLTVVGLLKGSFVFVADLVRALGRLGMKPRIEFLRLSSYGCGRGSTGAVRLVGEIPAGLADRPVLLVDDIVDTGRSLAFAKALLTEHGAAQILTCTLIDKPSRREIALAADLVGFVVPDVFVVGYGIDYSERYRYLSYVGTID